MSLRAITAIIEDTKEMRQLLAGLRNGAYPYQVSGLSGADKAAYIAALFNKTLPRPLLLLTLGNRRAQDLALDLEVFVDNGRVCLFPDVEVLPHEEVAAPLEIMVSRLEVLEGLARGSASLSWPRSMLSCALCLRWRPFGSAFLLLKQGRAPIWRSCWRP